MAVVSLENNIRRRSNFSSFATSSAADEWGKEKQKVRVDYFSGLSTLSLGAKLVENSSNDALLEVFWGPLARKVVLQKSIISELLDRAYQIFLIVLRCFSDYCTRNCVQYCFQNTLYTVLSTLYSMNNTCP